MTGALRLGISPVPGANPQTKPISPAPAVPTVGSSYPEAGPPDQYFMSRLKGALLPVQCLSTARKTCWVAPTNPRGPLPGLSAGAGRQRRTLLTSGARFVGWHLLPTLEAARPFARSSATAMYPPAGCCPTLPAPASYRQPSPRGHLLCGPSTTCSHRPPADRRPRSEWCHCLA